MVKGDEIFFKGNPNIIYPKAPGRGLSFKCYKCPSIFDRKESLLTHSSLHGANKTYKCHVCDYSVNSSDLLSKHMSKHRSQNEFKVNVPVRTPKYQSMREQKLAEATRPKFPEASSTLNSNEDVILSNHECPECPASYFLARELRAHMYNHGSGEANKCEYCSYATRRKDHLQKHRLLHDTHAHPKEDTAISVAPLIECPECPSVFRSQTEFGRHMNRHSGQRQAYSCSKCSYSTTRSATFEGHLMLHERLGDSTIENSTEAESQEPSENALAAEKKNFSCNIPTNLPGGRSTSCLKCPFVAANKTDFERHSNAHGARRRFKCSFCDYSVGFKSLMVSHELLHRKKQVNHPMEIASSVTSRPYKSRRRNEIKGGTVEALNPLVVSDEEDKNKVQNLNPVHKPIKKWRNRRKLKKKKDSEYLPSKSAEVQLPFSKDLRKAPASSQLVGKTVSSLTRIPLVQTSKILPGILSVSLKDSYSVEPFDASQTDCSKFLIERVKIENFMSIEAFDVAPTNVLTFQGIGKSASLSALLVGLGYDILVENYYPEYLCGVNVDDFIRKGKQESTIELTISLHSSPELNHRYGTHLKLFRKLQKGLPLGSTTFEVASADEKKRFPESFEPIGKPRLRKLLEYLGITSQFSKLILLDEANLLHVLRQPSAWYNFFSVTYDLKKQKIEDRLRILMLKLDRLQGELKWRKLKEEYLLELNVRESSRTKAHTKEKVDLETELTQLEDRQTVLQSAINSYLNDLNKLSNTITGRLKFRYQEFLQRQNFSGTILVSEEERAIGIAIMDVGYKVVQPRTVEEIASSWKNTRPDLQRIAVIGLFLH